MMGARLRDSASLKRVRVHTTYVVLSISQVTLYLMVILLWASFGEEHGRGCLPGDGRAVKYINYIRVARRRRRLMAFGRAEEKYDPKREMT